MTDGATPRSAAQRRLLVLLVVVALPLIALGLAAGMDGLSWRALQSDLASDQATLIVGGIRAPRTIGALFVGALLGLAGAIAQGLFRNPLADPYLLGSAAGAGFAVVVVLAAGNLAGHVIGLGAAAWLDRLGLVVAAFCGALAGVVLTLLLARGAAGGGSGGGSGSTRLLLAGVVVGILLGAAGDLLTLVSPAALRGRQLFLLGNTGFLGWASVALLGVGVAITTPIAMRLARMLDAMTLGDDSASSLGLPLATVRSTLVVVFAFATGLAVSQAGLVAFVGLVAPHLVRRLAPGTHAFLLLASTLTGGVLLLAADVAARSVMAPQELPVGVITALVGGVYLLGLLRRTPAS